MSHVKYIVLTAAAAAIVLWTLGVPVLQALPFTIFLACPLMMLFMMRGMDHGGHEHAAKSPGGAEPAVGQPESADALSKIDQQYRR